MTERGDSIGKHITGGVHLSTVAFLALLTVFLLPWILLALHTHPHDQAAETGIKSNGPGQKADTNNEVREGPWGRLVLTPILITPVDQSLPAGWSRPPPTSWLFAGQTESSLRAFLSGLSLFADEKADLLNRTKWKIDPSGIRVYPDSDTIVSLDETTRAKIYAQLALHKENPAHARPWSLKAADFETRLKSSGLTVATQALIKKVAYRAGNRIFVSDGPTVVSNINDEKEKIRVLRFLKSAETYMVKMEIHPADNPLGALGYWDNQQSVHDFRPILESVLNSADGGYLDLIHILPDFARDRLYTYPERDESAAEIRRDCHWSSLNFFATDPDDRFGQTEHVQQYVLENYYQSSEEPAYGDIIFFTTQAGETLHSATFLAANLTFTKNGDDPYQPWIIMDADDLEQLYSSVTQSPVFRQTWKKKKLPGG